MNVEQTLTDELRAVTEFQAPPPPSFAEVSRMAHHERGRVRRTRLAVTAAVAAAIVAAVVIGTQTGRPNAAPGPIKPSPSYYADGVPYFQHGGLYIDHERQPGDWMWVESAGDYTVAQAADRSAEILKHGKQIMQIEEPLIHSVRLSPDGTKAAWIASTGADAGVLVVRDLVASRDLGRLPLVLRPKNKSEGVAVSLLVRTSGRAYYSVNDTSWSWTPGGGSPTRSDSPNDPGPTGYPRAADFAGVHVGRVRLSPDHLWGAWMTDPDGHELDGDPTGRALGVTVQKPGDPASRFTLPLPTGLDLPPIVFWDTPTEITFAGPENLRCSIVDRRCRALGTS